MHAPRTCFAAGSGSTALSRWLSFSRTAALTSALALLLTACGGGGGGGFNPAAAGSVTPGSSSTGNSSGNNTAPPTPVYSIGNGSGTGYTDGVIDASKTTLQAAETATLRVNIVDQFNNPPATDLVVTFSSTCTSDGLASFGDVTQVARGLFSVTYTNKGCDKAADVVTALLVTNNKQATVTLKMVGPDVISVSFVSATFTQLALAGIGGNETSELIFQVSGPQAVPVVGKTVNFSVNTQVGGASILSGRQSAVTDQAGQVHTIITSGTIAGPVNVRAVEQSTGKQGISPDIVISTGIADADRFSMTLGPHNPGLAWNTDAVTVNINIIASDIFGNNPTDGTRVSFVSSESGNITNSCLLTDGACSATWRSSASRPLDMRATVMAYTSGAEHFTDNNGNGVYDSTDTTFKDLGEAYADENENGQYDVGEYFVDTNKNGVRDPGNNLWDGPCLSKVDSRAVCTGNSTVTISGSQVIVMSRSDVRIKTLGTFPDPALGTIISVTKGGYADLGGMYLEDGNTNADILGGNPLPNQSTVVFSIEGDSLSLKGISSYTISDGISPESSPPLGVSIFADSGAVSGTTGVLRMTVTAPGLTTQFTWSVKIP